MHFTNLFILISLLQSKEEYMDEIILDDVVESLVANAFTLATTECSSFEWDYKEVLRNVFETLLKIKFLLHDAQKRQVSDESVRRWLTELRDVTYDADNVLDEFSYGIFWQKLHSQNQMMNQVRSFSLCNPNEVKTIKQLLDKIVNDAADFGLRMDFVNPIPNISLEMDIDCFLDDLEVFGREYNVTKIVNILISSNNQQVISILPIVGMAGLGKTTLAKIVYDHEWIKKHFGGLAWVHVSRTFNVEEILREVPKFKDDEVLQRKKYLLVLDDVQNDDLDKWDTLRSKL